MKDEINTPNIDLMVTASAAQILGTTTSARTGAKACKIITVTTIYSLKGIFVLKWLKNFLSFPGTI